MNVKSLLLLCVVCMASSCSVYESESETDLLSEMDTVPPVIFIDRSVDTAYLYTSYAPSDVRVVDRSYDRSMCNGTSVSVSGNLDLNMPGVYFLNYNVCDKAGNQAATVTRTVHVVENRTAFMNGPYAVISTCTCVSGEDRIQTVNTSEYNAEISSEPVNGNFKLISLKIGKDHVAISSYLEDHFFDVNFFNPDYHLQSRGTGTLSSSRNSFTIESVAYHYSGDVYRCQSVFRKKLIQEIK